MSDKTSFNNTEPEVIRDGWETTFYTTSHKIFIIIKVYITSGYN